MMRPIKTLSNSSQILCLAVLTLTGCQGINAYNPAGLYIHNEERAKLSQEARDSFDTYRKGSLNVFDQMQSNLNVSGKFWTDSTNIATSLQTDVFIQAIPLYTWKELLSPKQFDKKIGKKNIKIDSVYLKSSATLETQNNASLDSLKDAVAMFGVNKEELKDREAIIKSLEAKFKKQEKENIKYEKNIQDFRKAIINLAKNGTDISADDLTKSVLVNQNLDLSKGPGFKTSLISLALDLAEAERDRTSTEIDFLQKVINNATEQQSIVKEADEILKEAAGDYEDFPKPGGLKNFNEKQRITNTIVKVLEQYHAATSVGARLKQYSNLQTILEVIGNIAVVESIYIPELKELEQELVALEHYRSIQVSRINASAREDIISRGLQSLAIYHEGGIRPEEIAQFIYAVALVTAVAL